MAFNFSELLADSLIRSGCLLTDLSKYFLISLDEGNNGFSIILSYVFGLIAGVFSDLWAKLS